MINDALDLYCLCHHRKYARPYLENHYRTYAHIVKICNLAFDLVAGAIHALNAANYNALAHAAEVAGVGVHMCKVGTDGEPNPCGGVAAPDAVHALDIIQEAIEDYIRQER
eukprot:6193191-Amphidinium_carterae.1